MQVRLISGIGNNLYQIATLYHLSKQNGKEWSVIYPKHDGGIQEIRANGGHYSKKIDDVPFYIEDVFPNVNWKDSADINNETISSYIFNIDALWGSISDIKKILKPSQKLIDYIHTKYPKVEGEKRLGIHLRYTNGSDSFLAEDNIYEWINDIIEKNSDCNKIVVVSNYLQHAMNYINNNLKIKFPNISIQMIEDEPNFVDMFILADCDVIVCSNSTFSFWSGALSSTNTKVYMCPEYKPANVRNSIPKEWITNSEIYYKYYVRK